MTGYSDVRLLLQGLELDALAQAPRVHSPLPAPTLGRWKTLLIRLGTRRQLLELDAEQLKDIGLTRGQAMAEAMKPFWKS
jgi:uncharacterized protein YjiS (DUF1127 family)